MLREHGLSGGRYSRHDPDDFLACYEVDESVLDLILVKMNICDDREGKLLFVEAQGLSNNIHYNMDLDIHGEDVLRFYNYMKANPDNPRNPYRKWASVLQAFRSSCGHGRPYTPNLGRGEYTMAEHNKVLEIIYLYELEHEYGREEAHMSKECIRTVVSDMAQGRKVPGEHSAHRGPCKVRNEAEPIKNAVDRIRREDWDQLEREGRLDVIGLRHRSPSAPERDTQPSQNFLEDSTRFSNSARHPDARRRASPSEGRHRGLIEHDGRGGSSFGLDHYHGPSAPRGTETGHRHGSFDRRRRSPSPWESVEYGHSHSSADDSDDVSSGKYNSRYERGYRR